MAKPSEKIVSNRRSQRTRVGAKVATDSCTCPDPCEGEAGGGGFTCEDGVMTYVPPPSGAGFWLWGKSSNTALPGWYSLQQVQQMLANTGNQAMPAQSVMRTKKRKK